MTELDPVTSSDFSEKVLQAKQPVLVDFGAPWCGPCKMLEPILVEMAQDYLEEVAFYSVDVDQSPQLASEYGVMGVPTVILFQDGQPVNRVTGFRPRKVLEKTFF